jgi:hypothetical protein
VHWVMTEYRCFLFAPEDDPSGGERIYVAAETFQAKTDAEAQVKAHGICRRRRHAHGFEIWQADTLVHRHSPQKSATKQPKDRSRPKAKVIAGDLSEH